MPEKTGDISRRHQQFLREMTSEKRAKKFDTDDLWDNASDWLEICFNQSEALPRSG